MPDDTTKLFIKENNDTERKVSDDSYSPIILWHAIRATFVIVFGAAVTAVIGIFVSKIL